jgi:predicted signal transduction protein with EAL and GGDEF domain
VENLEQIRLLREFGYQLGQGYHFSRPLTAEQFGRLLTETGGFVDVRASLAQSVCTNAMTAMTMASAATPQPNERHDHDGLAGTVRAA